MDNPFNNNNVPNFVPFAVSKVRFTPLILTKYTPKMQIKKKVKNKWEKKKTFSKFPQIYFIERSVKPSENVYHEPQEAKPNMYYN